MKTKQEIRRMFVKLMVECEKHLDESGCSMEINIGKSHLAISFEWDKALPNQIDQEIKQAYESAGGGKRGWASAVAKKLGMTANNVRVRHHRMNYK